MPSYYVRSVWYIGILPEWAWKPLIEVENWSQWWPEVLSSMELEAGFGESHGSLKRCTWRGAIPPEFIFNLRITRVVQCSLLEAEIRGRLEGTTRWTLTPQEEGCSVHMEWSFRTHVWWMDLLGSLTRRIYPRVFDSILSGGGRALEESLGAPLLPPEKVRPGKGRMLA